MPSAEQLFLDLSAIAREIESYRSHYSGVDCRTVTPAITSASAQLASASEYNTANIVNHNLTINPAIQQYVQAATREDF